MNNRRPRVRNPVSILLLLRFSCSMVLSAGKSLLVRVVSYHTHAHLKDRTSQLCYPNLQRSIVMTKMLPALHIYSFPRSFLNVCTVSSPLVLTNGIGYHRIRFLHTNSRVYNNDASGSSISIYNKSITHKKRSEFSSVFISSIVHSWLIYTDADSVTYGT